MKNGAKMKRSEAVIYARVSSKEQEKEGYSIPAQLKLLNQYAKDNGFRAIHEYVDVETAKQAGRSSFGEMVNYLKKNPDCRVVITEKTDRLYRNMRDYVILDDIDLELHFVKENVILSKDSRSSEKFIHGIKVLMAKNFIDNLSEETKKGMNEKAEQGLWPSMAPLGYINAQGSDDKRTIIPDPETSSIIARMFERYATGNYSMREVSTIARKEGLVLPKSGTPINLATTHRILHNRIYSGYFEWNGKMHKGKYTPLIAPELWETVQNVLHGHNLKKHRKAKNDFAFSRLITCGHCGCSLVGEIKKGRYIYYHCTGYKGKCPEPYAREEVLEAHFAKALQALNFDSEIMNWIIQALKESHQDEKEYLDEAIARLQKKYATIQHRIETMYTDKLDGRIDNDFFDQKANEWRNEQVRILRDIEQYQNANQSYFEEGIQILELARKASSLFEKQPPLEKRRLLNFVLSNCTWKDRGLDVTYRQPFDIIAKTTAIENKKKIAEVVSGDNFEIWRPR